MESHLLQMRGLKLAFISTNRAKKTSHLLQMRGLKPWSNTDNDREYMSHLLQMRGLKLNILIPRALVTVASFTDAWIETKYINTIQRRISRIFYRCVDWNTKDITSRRIKISRIFYRCVDWNRAYEAIYNAYIRSHLLQMRGLKLWRGEQSNGYYVSHLLQMRGLKQGVVTNINIKTSRIFYRCVDWNSFLRSNWA